MGIVLVRDWGNWAKFAAANPVATPTWILNVLGLGRSDHEQAASGVQKCGDGFATFGQVYSARLEFKRLGFRNLRGNQPLQVFEGDLRCGIAQVIVDERHPASPVVPSRG